MMMRVGLDFDNTIVSYDVLFHKVAREQDVVPPDTPVNKLAVRDYLRRVGREEVWTEIQGTVYGARMNEAVAYPGVIEFLIWANQVGHEIAIVSHKTKHPFLGPQYDLHAAARTWVEQHLCKNGSPLIPSAQVFFELTKEEKLARIRDFRCDVFLDDLPEILQANGFPVSTWRILFDPDGHHTAALPGIPTVQSWDGFAKCLRQ
jgi:hypothetical protein